MKHAHEARLTYNVDRHVKKQSVPRYHVERTAKSPSPFPEPDTLGFAFEEDEPVVYLTIGDQRIGTGCEWNDHGCR